jgi:succinate dehydrogenase / fumarate reductase cytochrome b subunit
MALVLYLILHLIVISQLYGGPERWDTFLKLTQSSFFPVFDDLLFGGVIFHGLNGLRLTLLSLGYVLRWQKKLFWLNLAVTLGLTIGYILVLLGN